MTKILTGLGTRIINDRIIITTTAHHKPLRLLVGPLVKVLMSGFSPRVLPP